MSPPRLFPDFSEVREMLNMMENVEFEGRSRKRSKIVRNQVVRMLKMSWWSLRDLPYRIHDSFYKHFTFMRIMRFRLQKNFAYLNPIWTRVLKLPIWTRGGAKLPHTLKILKNAYIPMKLTQNELINMKFWN